MALVIYGTALALFQGTHQVDNFFKTNPQKVNRY
jgi:hypothetical protein